MGCHQVDALSNSDVQDEEITVEGRCGGPGLFWHSPQQTVVALKKFFFACGSKCEKSIDTCNQMDHTGQVIENQ